MRVIVIASAFCCTLCLGGCAGMVFSEKYKPDGLTFYDPVPHLKVTVAADCTITSEVVTLPGRERSVRFIRGIGSSALGVTLANGMIASVNQTTDSKIPETIGAVAGLATAAEALVTGGDGAAPGLMAGAQPTPKPPTCRPEMKIYAIGTDKDGKPMPLEAGKAILNYPVTLK